MGSVDLPGVMRLISWIRRLEIGIFLGGHVIGTVGVCFEAWALYGWSGVEEIYWVGWD